MDEARKRRIPVFCSRVAVVTSLSGAVIDDVKRVSYTHLDVYKRQPKYSWPLTCKTK